MGYRSEVKSVIYGALDAMDKFMTDHANELDQIKDEFNNEVKVMASSNRKFIYLSCDYAKWYDEYDEVQHWHEFLKLAQQAGLNTEFVRVGEASEGDIETEYHGAECLNYLEPMIKIDVGFDLDDQVKVVA